MASGIVTIKWANGTADETIQSIITALYKDNEDVITGMNYLETEHDQVATDVNDFVMRWQPEQRKSVAKQNTLSSFDK